MKRTPIIVQGQVYLPRDPQAYHYEYLVVSKVNRTDISFRGPGFNGMNDVELFLERFAPVDPQDLSIDEQQLLLELITSTKLLTGWVEPDDDDGEDEEY